MSQSFLLQLGICHHLRYAKWVQSTLMQVQGCTDGVRSSRVGRTPGSLSPPGRCWTSSCGILCFWVLGTPTSMRRYNTAVPGHVLLPTSVQTCAHICCQSCSFSCLFFQVYVNFSKCIRGLYAHIGLVHFTVQRQHDV